MIGETKKSRPTYVNPVRVRSWMPSSTETVGDEQIPVLGPPRWHGPPESLCAIDKCGSAPNRHTAFLHGYRADRILEPLARSPSSYVDRFRPFAGLITPDFSLYRNMPRCERAYHTRVSRAVGAYFQSRGFAVIPNVRWADDSDYDYCFLGIPPGSVLAVSAHGCSRSREDRYHFRAGLEAMLTELRPHSVLVHGPMSADLFESVASQTHFTRYPSDIEIAHRKGA